VITKNVNGEECYWVLASFLTFLREPYDYHIAIVASSKHQVMRPGHCKVLTRNSTVVILLIPGVDLVMLTNALSILPNPIHLVHIQHQAVYVSVWTHIDSLIISGLYHSRVDGRIERNKGSNNQRTDEIYGTNHPIFTMINSQSQ